MIDDNFFKTLKLDEERIKILRKELSSQLGVSEEQIGMSITEFDKIISELPEFNDTFELLKRLVKNTTLIGTKVIDKPNGISFYISHVVTSLTYIIEHTIPVDFQGEILISLKKSLELRKKK